MYASVCLYVCVRMCLCAQCVHMSLYTCMYVCVHVYTCLCTRYTYVCVRVCVCASVYVCSRAFTCLCRCVLLYEHASMYVVCLCMQTCTSVHVLTLFTHITSQHTLHYTILTGGDDLFHFLSKVQLVHHPECLSQRTLHINLQPVIPHLVQ